MFCCFIVVFVLLQSIFCGYEWRFLGGLKENERASEKTKVLGLYGILGEYAPTNWPGIRENFQLWKLSEDQILIYGGGFQYDTYKKYFSDSWIYSMEQGEWMYVNGPKFPDNANATFHTIDQYNDQNHPGAREGSCGWNFGTNEVQLFGGRWKYEWHSELQHANDVFRFNIQTREWKWLYGNEATNVANDWGGVLKHPGGRAFMGCWKKSVDTFVLFGGDEDGGVGSRFSYNDVWEYSSQTGEWATSSSPLSENSVGAYLEKDVYDGNNFPRSRFAMAMWGSTSGFYIYGGISYDSFQRMLHDFWHYDASSGNWGWLHGDSSFDIDASYSKEYALGNTPGSRAVMFNDYLAIDDSTIFIFGGTTSTVMPRNDVWEYDLGTNLFRWIGGTDKIQDPGVYSGEIGVYQQTALPYSRGSGSMVRMSGRSWLMFGGTVTTFDTNEFWEYGEVFRCAGILETDSTTCYGHGECIGDDNCDCDNGFDGTFCEISTCDGIKGDDPKVCNEAGRCVDTDLCDCDSEFAGNICQFPSCDGIFSNQSSKVCSGHGNCVALERCACNKRYYGSVCQSDTKYLDALVPILVVLALCVIGAIVALGLVFALVYARVKKKYHLVGNEVVDGDVGEIVVKKEAEIEKLRKEKEKMDAKEAKRAQQLEKLKKQVTNNKGRIDGLNDEIRQSQKQLDNMGELQEYLNTQEGEGEYDGEYYEEYNEQPGEGGEEITEDDGKKEDTPAKPEEDEKVEKTVEDLELEEFDRSIKVPVGDVEKPEEEDKESEEDKDSEEEDTKV